MTEKESFSLPRTPELKTTKIKMSKFILRNIEKKKKEQYHSSFYFNGHTLEFHPRTQSPAIKPTTNCKNDQHALQTGVYDLAG